MNHNVHTNECHIQRCRDCGTEVLTRQYEGRPVLCVECKAEVHRQNDRARYARVRKSKPDPDCFIVVYDPDEDYGYSKGARFTREQLRCMFPSVHETMNIGTQLKNVAGELFEVVKEENRYKLSPV